MGNPISALSSLSPNDLLNALASALNVQAGKLARAAADPNANAVPSDQATLSTGGQPAADPGLFVVQRARVFSAQANFLELFVNPDNAPAPSPATETNIVQAAGSPDDRFRAALDKLGLDPRSERLLLRIGQLLSRLDPKAFGQLVTALEGFLKQLPAADTADQGAAATPVAENSNESSAPAPQSVAGGNGSSTPPAAQDSAPVVTAPATGSQAQFRVEALSFQLSFTEIDARIAQPASGGNDNQDSGQNSSVGTNPGNDPNVRQVDVRFEQLQFAFSCLFAEFGQPGAPVQAGTQIAVQGSGQPAPAASPAAADSAVQQLSSLAAEVGGASVARTDFTRNDGAPGAKAALNFTHSGEQE